MSASGQTAAAKNILALGMNRSIFPRLDTLRRIEENSVSAYATTGLQSLGEVPWGSHVCQFFSNGSDLRDTLVPYFKAGLENNERCLLVAMEPFSADSARSALRAAVGDFDRRERRKQIEIHDVRAWYNSDTIINGEEIVAGLLASEEQARADGYNGFRTHGNIGWLGRNQWEDFQDYEAGVTRGLRGRRMISMCGYCLDNCGSKELLDVTTRHSHALTRQRDGWSCVAVTPHEPNSRNSSGNVADVTNSIRLVTDAPELRQALERQKQAFDLAMVASDMGTWRYTLADNICVYDENAQRLYGLTEAPFLHDDEGVKAKFHPDDMELMWSRVATALDPKGSGRYDVEYRVKQLDGNWRWLSAWGLVEFEGEGLDRKPVAIAGASRDLTKLKQAEELQGLLLNELNHRIQNTLATVQAIASSTIRASRTMDDFKQAFYGRIATLSKTHSLLTDNERRFVPLRQLLKNELEIYEDGEGQRISLSGPEVMLPAHVSVSFAMAIHELTTNALKYGALSVLAGVLRVSWKLDGTRLIMRWEESNVPITRKPTRVGFGSQLLQRLLPQQLGAQVEMKFARDGLEADISIQIA
jgi:two-component sensor histidine kinase